jgi:hypothetical protein
LDRRVREARRGRRRWGRRRRGGRRKGTRRPAVGAGAVLRNGPPEMEYPRVRTFPVWEKFDQPVCSCGWEWCAGTRMNYYLDQGSVASD